MPSDLEPGPLFGNTDKAEFDREKDALIEKLRDEGHEVSVEE